MNERRPDPDALLRAINAEDRSAGRGALKIFLGMCAGSGKTYAMLESAHRALEAGIDVVVGLVETHGRVETEALLHGLEEIPRARIPYRGSVITDLDIDAVLARHPQLVLVDELAHTNPEGSRHKRRFQDIEEILDNGIDVYTTLNVQHLESRADDVERITDVPIRERVPDSILQMASDIEVVDLTPDELLTRLKEGKVYTPERSTAARFNFFRRGNLVALREMALRTAAERVDLDLRTYRERYSIDATWPTTQSFLVAVAPGQHATRLIRWTYRAAQERGIRWVAACVRKSGALSAEQQRHLQAAATLVDELGGEMEWIDDDDVVNGLLTIAHRRNVTTIVVGRHRHRNILSYFLSVGIVAKLIERAHDVNIHVVASESDKDEQPQREVVNFNLISKPWAYVLTLLSAVGMWLIGLAILPVVGYQAVGMILLLFVTILPAIAPRGPVLLTAVFTAFAWNLLFIPPRFTFQISRLEDQLTFALYLTTAFVSAWLSTRIRRRELVIRRREERTEQLYGLAADANSAVTISEIATVLERRVGEIIDADVVLLIPGVGGHDTSFTTHGNYRPDEKEMATATWVSGHRRAAGVGTETLPFATSRYIPLVVGDRHIGVMGIHPRTSAAQTFSDQGVVDRIIRQVTWSVERIRLTEEASRVQRAEDAEQLSRTVLNAVSHELRTPLSSIIASASTLADVLGDELTEQQRQLAHDIQSSSMRLNGIVTDLLDMAQIDAGKLEVRRIATDLREATDAMIALLRDRSSSHKLFVELDPPSPPDVLTDPTILLQVLSNLVDNGIRHTPAGTSIALTVRLHKEELLITVDDDGPGIADADLPHVFERFWRSPRSTGSGLGLSIVKGLSEALGGRIVASRSPMGGARFTVTMPVQVVDTHET